MGTQTAEAFLGLGSNLAVREAHLAYALERLGEETHLRSVSSVYETDPLGYADQGPFLNMVVRVGTGRGPRELLDTVRGIEADRGRLRSFRNAPRTLDIDVLLYEDRVVEEDGLVVPHPRMGERPFVLVPLLELEPALVDPVLGTSYRDQLARLAGGVYGDLDEEARRLGVRRVMDGEELLDGRRE